MNSFSLGGQVGGRTSPKATAIEQELRDYFNKWKGEYSSSIREFAFLLRIDGNIHKYTEMWNICGAQPAKRKRDWIEVEIGIPESWWKDESAYKGRLAHEVEQGLLSMIDLLRRRKFEIRADLLMNDWRNIEANFMRENRVQ